MKHRILIASPVKQKERILSEFLDSLTHLEASQVELDFAFIDDYNDHTLLSRFALERQNVRVFLAIPREITIVMNQPIIGMRI